MEPEMRLELRVNLVPALYRVLSTSSTQESRRLLVRVAPELVAIWGGIGTEDSTLFWDNEPSPRATLGSYWNEEKIMRENGWERINGSESTLSILCLSESLLRLALDPYPRIHRTTLMCVYGFDAGYDMLVDQVASLIPPAIKVSDHCHALVSGYALEDGIC